jgi:hypothetical protein
MFKRVLWIVLCTGFCWFQALGQADEVDQLHRQKFKMMISQKTDLLQELFDDQLTYTHSNGWIETKDEVISNITSGKLQYHQVEILQAQVRYYEQTAVVNGVANFKVSLDGKEMELRLVYTEVYVNQDGWKLVSRHASRLPEEK